MTTEQITRLNPDGSLTREWLLGHPNPAEAQVVRLTRHRLYPVVAHPGPAWRWLYSYQADDGPIREYGTGLTDAIRCVRRVFPNAKVIKTWAESSR